MTRNILTITNLANFDETIIYSTDNTGQALAYHFACYKINYYTYVCQIYETFFKTKTKKEIRCKYKTKHTR